MGERSCCRRISEFIPARVVLGCLSFLGFMVTQMLRSSLYIAVVVMVKPANVSNVTEIENNEYVPWSSGSQGLVLSAFFWSYWLSELPGGILAQRLGPRLVLAIATFTAGVLSIVLPFACHAGVIPAAGVRALQGLALGVTWPAMHCMSGRWIPAVERSKFMSSYHGTAIGDALIFPLGGLLIAHCGWSWVFYLSGALSIMWSFLWWILVRDSPDQHPRLSGRERRYLARTLRPSASRRAPTPWRNILTSAPFWAVLCASIGLMWGTITLSMQLPSYFRLVHNLNIKTIGLLSGIPEICKCVFGFAFSAFIDWLLKRKTLSLTAARKLSVATCEVLPAILLVLLAVFGSEEVHVAVILITIRSLFAGASTSGSLPNVVDLSPNFAGAILGLIKTIAMFPGILSPIIASYLTKNVETREDVTRGWSNVFLLTAVIYVICCLVFTMFGDADVQSWDAPVEAQPPVQKQEEEQALAQ